MSDTAIEVLTGCARNGMHHILPLGTHRPPLASRQTSHIFQCQVLSLRWVVEPLPTAWPLNRLTMTRRQAGRIRFDDKNGVTMPIMHLAALHAALRAPLPSHATRLDPDLTPAQGRPRPAVALPHSESNHLLFL